MSIITLLTDFGTKDEYVGLMKGVVLSINPTAAIVDISHQIDPQDIVQAAFAIQAAYRYFPAGTVHLLVVDPGVGTDRALLALEMENQFFIAPDNGAMTLLLNQNNATCLVRLTNSDFFLDSVSQTFHGRDIIAPVGAHLSRGVDLRQLGDELTSADAVRLENIHPRISDAGEIAGTIVAVDHFGNLITNIDSQMLQRFVQNVAEDKIRVRIGSHTIRGISRTYENVRRGTALGLIGSRGFLEVAVNQGHAARELNAGKGDAVRVII